MKQDPNFASIAQTKGMHIGKSPKDELSTKPHNTERPVIRLSTSPYAMAAFLQEKLIYKEREITRRKSAGVDMENYIGRRETSEETSGTQPGFEITSAASGKFLLNVRGRFAPDWIVNLTFGISRNSINIIRGRAKKTGNFWQAEFELEKTPSATDPIRVDYLALIKEAKGDSLTTTIKIDKYLLEYDTKGNDGALLLVVKARDQLGFLACLLNCLAFYSLFPESINIDTVEGMISDRFLIRGVGGSPPSSTVVNSIKRKLNGFLLNQDTNWGDKMTS